MTGERMRRARELREMSRARCAELMGVTYRQLWRMETGRTRVVDEHLRSFCRAVGVTAGEIVDVLDAEAAG